MTFYHVPVHNSSICFEQILKHEAIRYFLVECQGFIAGGLAEKEFHGWNIVNYLKKDPGNYNGDIDIYFRNETGLKRAIEYAYEKSHTCVFKDAEVLEYPTHSCAPFEDFKSTMNYYQKGKFNAEIYDRNKHIRHVEPSCTDISYQAYIDLKFCKVSFKDDIPVKVQLIGKDFIGEIEEILNTFDFANVQLAYYIKKGQLFCCKRKERPANRFRNRNKLTIVNSHSPLLMHRIYKYMKHRGYEGITESSKHHVVNWLIRARSGEFKNPVLGITLWQDALNNTIIRRAIYDRTIPDDALPLIIGKVITEKRVYRGYRRYDYVKIDEAMEAIKYRRSGK